jgi:integrase
VAGLRTIPLGEGIVIVLLEWRGLTKFKGKDDLIFPNSEGGYKNHDNMAKRHFLPLFARLELRWQEERRNEPLVTFNWHALRHFAISCWIEAGLPPKAVQTFAGHSSLQVTMDRYGHLFKSDRHQAVMDGIAEQFAPATPSSRFPGKPPRTPELA